MIYSIEALISYMEGLDEQDKESDHVTTTTTITTTKIYFSKKGWLINNCVFSEI